MKKKFFTLFAAAALCSLASVNAQTAKPITAGEVHTAALKKGGLYHIGTGTSAYIYPNLDNQLLLGTDTVLAKAVWCVTASKPTSSTYPEFKFENKAEGIALGVDLAPYQAGDTIYPAVLTYSDVSTWRFSSTYQEGMDTEANYLMSYLPNAKDSVAVLIAKGDSVFVEIIKAPAAGTKPTPPAGYTLIEAHLYDAAPIVLDAAAFNTMFGSTNKTVAKGFNFIKPTSAQLEKSPLKDKFIATDVEGSTGYLLLSDVDEKKYLRVDTTVYNVAGNPYLKLDYSEAEDYKLLEDETLIKQHNFRLTYLPSSDSMIINVEKLYKPVKGNDLTSVGAWKKWTVEESNDDPLNIAKGHNQIPSADADDKTYVVVQNLTETKYCLTIGETPVQTHIGFGFTGCSVSDNRTSVQGLFVIQNTEGKYLQVPIYTDTVAPVAQWVTLEKYVDPFQMPSFQWVVEKTRVGDPDNISQITITNREYEGVNVGTVQLYTDIATQVLGAKVKATVKTNTKEWGKFAESFIEVPEAQRLDSCLGYKYVSDDIARLRTYTFNYLHEFDNSTYLSVKNSEKDSLLYVQKDNADGFELVPYHHSYTEENGWSVKPVDYGYTGKIEKINGKPYAAQLVRSAYVLKIKEGNKLYNTNKVVVVDKEKRFAVTPGDNDAIAAGDSAVFYLKTNNTKEGINYYALIDTASYSNENTPDRITIKAGVADHNLWVKAQNHYEIRTSAFAVEPNEEPLYRRFNREIDGIANGATDFYDDVDKPLNLRFHRVNNIREFLYEDSHSVYSEGKGIRFLGYKHESDFFGEKNIAERTTFFVDTAYVNRPAVKGAEFDTPKPQYLIGVGVYKVEGTTIAIPCEPSVTSPSYYRGRYLINATDSVYGVKRSSLAEDDWTSKWQPGWTSTNIDHSKDNNNDGINDYIWDTKWERLAFVDAVRLYDTLYVLNGASEYVDPIDFNKLRADERVRAIRLDNNLHKDVVFSFRLIDSEKKEYKDQLQNFLIESETEDRGANPMIAPMIGGWVKVQNGVPVISRGNYNDAITDAEKFNVIASKEDAVANEVIDATAVQVVAGNGNITIQNAAGKTVAISNILGQTITNTVISSDNATIAAPKGIVVVAIEGEDAVKAIVK